jgi:hypothetical protein
MGSGKTRKVARGPLSRLAQLFGGPSEGAALTMRDVGELGSDSRGAIFVEYVALLCLVSVGGAAAVVVLGAPLVALARFTQLVVGLPIP